jgi:hypothetical protein
MSTTTSTPERKRSTSRLGTYPLHVIASSIADVVESAGGWLFDRVMVGWTVNVLVSSHGDVRPLRILGVDTLRLESGFQSLEIEPKGPQALAVAGDVFADDARVRRHVLAAMDRGTEVTMWGDYWPTRVDRRVESVEHRLSVAARAFKARALVATATPHRPVGATEKFRSGARWNSPRGSDLSPAG